MVKNLPEIQWKSINVDDPDLACDGLIAFEECSNYTLFGKNNEEPSSKDLKRKSATTSKAQQTKKRKVSAAKTAGEIPLTPSKSGSSFVVEETDNLSDEYTKWNNYGVPESLIKGLQSLQFTDPTTIQAATLPAAILGHRDIVGAAETGSGKTLAFGLPIITGILNLKIQDTVLANEKPLYALILTPTRELAIQVKNHLKAVATFTDINIAVVLGGMAAVKQERVLSKNPEIVVATPGRLWELIQQGNPHLSKIENIKYLVIDETDRMLEKGHFQELHDLLERLNIDETKKKNRQNFVFSATLTLVHELPKYLLHKFKNAKNRNMTSEQKLQQIIQSLGITNPKIVDVTQGGGTSQTLSESRITCGTEQKDYYVYYFLQKHVGRTLIFCNSIGCVKRLTNLLSVLNCRPIALHASMQQRQRLKNLERFRDDEHGILIATDVAARGLDIPKIEHVLHYQTPRTSESYVHRSGRTARASNEGITVLLIDQTELQSYIKLCRTLQKSEDLPTFPIQDDYLNAVKQRVNLAREIDKLQLNIRKSSSEAGWLKKAAEEMDIIVDDFSKKFDTENISSEKKALEKKKKQLASLLAKPIMPKSFNLKFPLIPKEFNLENQDEDKSAVELLKSSVQASAAQKKKKIPLFRPKKQIRNRQ